MHYYERNNVLLEEGGYGYNKIGVGIMNFDSGPILFERLIHIMNTHDDIDNLIEHLFLIAVNTSHRSHEELDKLLDIIMTFNVTTDGSIDAFANTLGIVVDWIRDEIYQRYKKLFGGEECLLLGSIDYIMMLPQRIVTVEDIIVDMKQHNHVIVFSVLGR